MKNAQKGFTLIELLVVISIISLVSSIVFASLNSAREKASNAAVLQFAHVMTLYISNCYISGGTPLDFTSSTGGGNICSDLALDPHQWPAPPSGWIYVLNTITGHVYSNFGGPGWSLWLKKNSSTLHTKCDSTTFRCIQVDYIAAP